MSDTNNPVINLQVDLKKANILLAGLAELPWRVSNDAIIEVREQMIKQMQQGSNVTKFTAGD
jgi:hypothetical protein